MGEIAIQMKWKIFEQWVKKELVPDLPPKRFVVTDNLSYHIQLSVLQTGSKPSPSNLNKDLVKDFLNALGNEFNSKYSILIQLYIVYGVDDTPMDITYSETRHYHFDLNPLELVLDIYN